jgi:predicted CXXCH cytochrome family protein
MQPQFAQPAGINYLLLAGRERSIQGREVLKVQSVGGIRVLDRKTFPFKVEIGYLLVLLCFSKLLTAQDPSLELAQTPDVLSSQTAVIKPLWGGPTSFDPAEDDFGNQVRLHQATSLHHFDLGCEQCHDGGVFDDSGDFLSPSLGHKVDINTSCSLSGCHPYEPVLNHPIDIRPTDYIPEEYRLGEHNLITCLTCHDQPLSTHADPSRTLTIPDSMDFCSSCHLQMSGTQKETAHWQFSTKAHLGPILVRKSSQLTAHSSALFDAESTACLSCHEDVTPGNTENKSMSNHPIGMDYSAAASMDVLRYNRLSQNDRHIRLFDGKVGCGSCHSLYSSVEKNLVQDNTGSRLCFECHNM